MFAFNNKTDAQAIKLIQFLKINSPTESYENPKLTDDECTEDEKNLVHHKFYWGLELPGSRYNPFGHLQNFSSFFIDMFFGNLTESVEYMKGLTKEELDKAMNKREGYCKFNPVFAPVLGLKMLNLEEHPLITRKEKNEIRTMFSGNNENKHAEILELLLQHGADPNAHDIHGNTPLHYLVPYGNVLMVESFLKYNANPNAENRSLWRPLSLLLSSKEDDSLRIVDLLLKHGAILTNKECISKLRAIVQASEYKELVVRVREAMPIDTYECERCGLWTDKCCKACSLTFYCSRNCQRLDWKIHKLTCKKNHQKAIDFVKKLFSEYE